MPKSAYVHLPGEGRVLDLGPFVMTIKGDAGRVLEGEYVVFVEGEEHQLATANSEGTSFGDDELSAMAARYGMRVLGPVPAGYL